MKNISEFENGQNILPENVIKIIELIQQNMSGAHEDKKTLILIVDSHLFLIDYYLGIKNIEESQIQLNFSLNYTKNLGKYSILKLKVFERAVDFYEMKNSDIRKNHFSYEANIIRTKIFGEKAKKSI